MTNRWALTRTLLAVLATVTFIAIAVYGGTTVWANARALGRRSALLDYQARLAERSDCRDDVRIDNDVAVDDVVLLLAAEGSPDPAAFAEAVGRLQVVRDRLHHIDDPDVCGPLPRKPKD